ncbi:hypothetical protein FRC06_001390 [Ceratobasidium sp. 370]|nr:hypothetical protein FRC06_001390 [Ceratobasidium sp. 370]
MRITTTALITTFVATPIVFGQLDAKIRAKGNDFCTLVAIMIVHAKAGWYARTCSGKVYFGAVTDGSSSSLSQSSAIIKSDFGALTSQNSAKWDATEPSKGSFNFAAFDALVNFAQANGNRYKGKIYAWDVVNEIFNEDGTLRSSVFSNVLGENFVTIAFKAARSADPSAKLYINDYNLDSVNIKVNVLVAFVNRQKSAGTPIDGIGTEAHLPAGGSGGILAALTKLATTGCDVAITELSIPSAPSSDYATVTKACLSVPSCIGISTAGVCDQAGSSSLLFDSNCQKKPAYNAVISVLS